MIKSFAMVLKSALRQSASQEPIPVQMTGNSVTGKKVVMKKVTLVYIRAVPVRVILPVVKKVISVW